MGRVSYHFIRISTLTLASWIQYMVFFNVQMLVMIDWISSFHLPIFFIHKSNEMIRIDFYRLVKLSPNMNLVELFVSGPSLRILKRMKGMLRKYVTKGGLFELLHSIRATG